MKSSGTLTRRARIEPQQSLRGAASLSAPPRTPQASPCRNAPETQPPLLGPFSGAVSKDAGPAASHLSIREVLADSRYFRDCSNRLLQSIVIHDMLLQEVFYRANRCTRYLAGRVTIWVGHNSDPDRVSLDANSVPDA